MRCHLCTGVLIKSEAHTHTQILTLTHKHDLATKSEMLIKITER